MKTDREERVGKIIAREGEGKTVRREVGGQM